MQFTTKFELNQRVTDGTVTGTIKTIQIDSGSLSENQIIYDLALDGVDTRTHVWLEEGKLSLAKLSVEEAWSDAVILIVEEIVQRKVPLFEFEKPEIRHKVYQFLGSNGIKFNDKMDAGRKNKARVRGLVERLEKILKDAEE